MERMGTMLIRELSTKYNTVPVIQIIEFPSKLYPKWGKSYTRYLSPLLSVGVKVTG